ncbi:hypothetical protein LINPERHAP2_LOCUS37135 [Linum perenne]
MFDDAGVPVRASYDAMANCSGGRENLRFTRSDLYNLVRTVRRTPMIHGEGHMLLDHFRAESNNNAGFYHEVKMDGNNIESIFSADATMRLDYQCFGDSITFDTMYRTNNEYRNPPNSCEVGHRNPPNRNNMNNFLHFLTSVSVPSLSFNHDRFT